MAFEIHREPLYRRYYAEYFSGACLYGIVFAFILIFLPLIIAYNTSDFWIKESVYYEQPDIQYRYQMITQLYGNSGSSPVNLYFSTSPTINQLYQSNLRMPILESAEFDDNGDGKVERLELNLQMPLADGEEINGIDALFYYEVQISKKARYIFDAVSHVLYETATGMSSLYVDGDLMMRQTESLIARGGYREPYNDDPLIEISEDMSADVVSMRELLMKSAARNLSLTFAPSYRYSVRDAVTRSQFATSESVSDATPRFFNASFTLRVPPQGIRYTPPVGEVLKAAWIQYVAFFVITAFLLFRLSSFVFRHQLLYTTPTVDVVMEKMG